MKLTQKDLILEYLKEFGSIVPAKMAGKIYKGIMFGSETSKRCRELREDNLIDSEPDGRFERFYCLGYLLAKKAGLGLKEKEESAPKLFEMEENERSPNVIF
jgi:hypothetical protein